MIYVKIARPGLRVPDGLGGFYGEVARPVERSFYVIRRIKDGSLLECAPPQAVAVAPVSEPEPLTEPPAERNKRRNSRG